MNIFDFSRQTTPYDDECSVLGPDGCNLGSRVFGDCDRLMKEVMLQILGETNLKRWEEGREERMVGYGMKRSSVK